MVRRVNGRQTWLCMVVAVAAIAIAVPAFAQSSAMVKGIVTDEKNEPVDGAKVTIEMQGGTGRRFETKTNKKGEYFQVGLSSGAYRVVAEKDKRGSQPVNFNVRVGNPATINLTLGFASVSATKEAQEKDAALKKIFAEAVALSSANQHPQAIEKFTAAIAVHADCFDCYNNIGYSYAQLKEWDKAEAAYKKSVELKPDDASSHSGLATVYNAQRKFDLAAAEGAKATQLSGGSSAAGGAGGNADAQYNEGVILWNAGKIADAKKSFESAVASNPNHAEAHYQLGMALVNEGNMAGAAGEFEKYLALAPTGPNAATAKSLVEQLKK